MQVFLTSITAAFTQSFNVCIDKIVDAIEKRLDQKIDSQASEIFSLNKRLERVEKANKDLLTENTNLKDSINQVSNKADLLAHNIDDLEQYSKGTNILVHGILIQAIVDSKRLVSLPMLLTLSGTT